MSGNEGFQKKLMMEMILFRLDEFVEVPDGYLWDDTALDNGRAFVQGGVYGKMKTLGKIMSRLLSQDCLNIPNLVCIFIPKYPFKLSWK